MSGTPDLRAEAERLKAATRLVAVIGQTVRMKRQGRFWTAYCPFHAEKTPSFYVYPDHYHCFGCGAHGDIFDWLMQTLRLTFPEAVARVGGAIIISTGRAPIPAAMPTRDDRARNREWARRIWINAVRPHDTIVETYLC
jgi:DNA primase